MKSDKPYLFHIRDAIKSIGDFISEGGEAFFYQDQKTQFAVLRGLEIIGEAARNISDETKILASDIPWLDVTGLRNKLIHEYFGVKLDTIWKIVVRDLPVLEETIDRLLNRLA